MSEIVTVPIGEIDANPFRLLQQYPYHPTKLETLQRSIADVGLWEGVIGRRSGKRYQIAFGHHRVEAARRNKLKQVPIIVRDLTDEDMLKLMGRENGEDYATDFLVLLTTWEAALKFYAAARPQKMQATDIARLLGWTTGNAGRDHNIMNRTAKACSSAHALMVGGYVSRDDLFGINVATATDILGRAHARMDQIEKMGAKQQRSNREIEQAKRHVGKAARQTASDVRTGKVASRDVRAQVDVHAFRAAGKSDRQSPLFAVFGRAVADQIERMVATDTAAEKLEEIVAVIGKITLDDDRACLRRIDFVLAELGERSEQWRKRLAGKAKVVPLKLLKQEA